MSPCMRKKRYTSNLQNNPETWPLDMRASQKLPCVKMNSQAVRRSVIAKQREKRSIKSGENKSESVHSRGLEHATRWGGPHLARQGVLCGSRCFL